MKIRTDILLEIEKERTRQIGLPGSEFDSINTPNDWIAIASHYLNEEVRRGMSKPDKNDFVESLHKAAAIIVAALEHVSDMEGHGDFRN